MAYLNDKSESRGNCAADACDYELKSRGVFLAFWGILFFCNFLVAGPWAGFHGVLLGAVGLLVLLCPPSLALPRSWWLLAAGFMVAGALSFFPASWTTQPAWRTGFETSGIATGPLIVIQARQAAEAFALFLIMMFVGLWLAGHRPSPFQLWAGALAFTTGVAVYAAVSRLTQQSTTPGAESLFGFFPNRNHSANYLAMGSICGLGCVFQALREKRFVMLAIALIATAICLWAVASWSVSRAGVLLVTVGALIWLPMLGKRYLGRHGWWAIGLAALAAVGIFLIADSGVKQRIAKTAERATSVMGSPDGLQVDEGGPEKSSLTDLDFRIPTALDTLGLIRDFKWTGVGAAQFRYIFPQYRNQTAVANDVISYHPESDWLWLASEVGLPATLALLALLILAVSKSLSGIRAGRQRALRGGCLAAALIVPFHGIFDVPGHRISLAWCAVFLFTLSLPPLVQEKNLLAPRRWLFRIAGVGICLIAVFLMRAQWWGGPQPALIVGDGVNKKAMALYQEDQKRLKAAEAAGQAYLPSPQEDLLEQALAVLDGALPVAPLDTRVRYLQGFIGLHFVDVVAESTKAFAIERVLNPYSVKTPMLQALAWARANPEKAVSLWEESLKRARRLDENHPGSSKFTDSTLSEIQNAARGNARVESLIKTIKSNPEKF